MDINPYRKRKKKSLSKKEKEILLCFPGYPWHQLSPQLPYIIIHREPTEEKETNYLYQILLVDFVMTSFYQKASQGNFIDVSHK